ncbi:MAG: hypothetical protein R2715_06885 [Ilumatobacteraceae bacterium]
MATTTIKVRCRRIAESLVWIERVLNTTTWRCIDSDEPMRWWLAVSAGVEDFYDLPSAVAALRDHARAPSSVRVAWTLDWEVDGEPMAMATVSGTLRSALGARSVLQFATEDPPLATVLGPRLREDLPALPPPNSVQLSQYEATSIPVRTFFPIAQPAPPLTSLRAYRPADRVSTILDRVEDELGVELPAAGPEMDPVLVEDV